MDYLLPTVIIVIIGLIGVVCAFVARHQLRSEFGPLARLKEFFADGKGPLHSLDPEKQYTMRPGEWLRDHQIALESHAADHLLGVWGGWLAGRLPTLGELHSLSARRERARSSARWAAGVAAVLLVCGVAGTLLAIHPVLNAFTIDINPDGTVQDASKSAERVMSMIHQLGNSFYPSIAAIVLTLGIVFIRSDYHRAAFDLGRELDRFTVDSLLPGFRLPTLGEEFSDTQARLSSLADAVTRRDADFAAAVKSLGGIITDMRAAGPELSTAAKEVAAAANRLSTDAVGIVNGLAKHLGADGALVKSIAGFKESVARNQDAAGVLAEASKTLEKTTSVLASAVQSVPAALEKGCADGIARFTEDARAASRELRADGRAARKEIAATIRESRVALDAAAAHVEGSADALVTRVAGSLGEEIRQTVADSITRHAPRPETTHEDSFPAEPPQFPATSLDSYEPRSIPAPEIAGGTEAADASTSPADLLPLFPPPHAGQAERLFEPLKERPHGADGYSSATPPTDPAAEEKPWFKRFFRRK